MHESTTQPQILREAWEQGLQQGLTQVAINLLKEDIDLALVAKVTGLSLTILKTLPTNDTDNTQALVKYFGELSESSLNNVWIDSEEDEAWKDL
jgi:hypothetical protein